MSETLTGLIVAQSSPEQIRQALPMARGAHSVISALSFDECEAVLCPRIPLEAIARGDPVTVDPVALDVEDLCLACKVARRVGKGRARSATTGPGTLMDEKGTPLSPLTDSLAGQRV